MSRWLSKEELRKRRKLVMHLRDKKGLTLSQIGKRLGLNTASVCHDYKIAKGDKHD